jgi:RNA 2',3'-cyclic 3'-phosphodiesterase
MNDIEKSYRLFIGIDFVAKWPEQFPDIDIIKEENRHLTLLFLGNKKEKVKEKLLEFPKPGDTLSSSGIFDKYVGIPKKNSRLIALEGHLINGINLEEYRYNIIDWFKHHQIEYEEYKRSFYPHLTICRKNFTLSKWEKQIVKVPFYLKGVHLYQSHQNSEYIKLKSYLFTPIFTQVEHTADIAFLIRGKDLQSLYINAQIALEFQFENFLNFLDLTTKIISKEQLVMALNTIVSNLDIEIGSPLKAISFHGKFQEKKTGYFEWEMIIDV